MDRRPKQLQAYSVKTLVNVAEGKNPKWNQTFQLEMKDVADGKVKISLC